MNSSTSNAKSRNGLSSKRGDPDLRQFARDFLIAFRAAAASSLEDQLKIFDSGRFHAFKGGTVELTDEVIDALRRFISRAAHLLGPKFGNERTLSQVALMQGEDFIKSSPSPDAGAATLIDAAFAEASAPYEFLAPNHLIIFEAGVRSIRIGPVEALLVEDFVTLHKTASPDSQLVIEPGPDFRISFAEREILVEMHPVCWLVEAHCAKENVEEEAKWLIDVAVSFLRLHYRAAKARFPDNGRIEPHPIQLTPGHQVGIKFRDETIYAGGFSVPRAYEVDADVVALTLETSFESRAETIFNAPKGSLAERVSQGLGWMTRGRQAEDRAERLLFFFTAIEALLSSDDKTAPVVQTIARHASVLLTPKNEDRAGIASQIKKLYVLRSALVHAGNRSVLWGNADLTQQLVETMFRYVMENGDLTMKHAVFCQQLADASYGFPWPPKGT